jgi:hypothetical protein
MRHPKRILGVATAALGALLLLPAALFLNERFNFVRMSWGVFDVQVGRVVISSAVAGTTLAVAGILLVAGGTLFTFRRSGSTA